MIAPSPYLKPEQTHTTHGETADTFQNRMLLLFFFLFSFQQSFGNTITISVKEDELPKIFNEEFAKKDKGQGVKLTSDKPPKEKESPCPPSQVPFPAPRAENAKINVTDEPYFGTQIVCNYLPFSKAAKGAQGGPQQYATFERKHSPTEK